MKDFYIRDYEPVEVSTPQLINGQRRYRWYKQIGREVNFSSLNFAQSTSFIGRGFAPAIPVNRHGICDNYLYPIDFGNTNDIAF